MRPFQTLLLVLLGASLLAPPAEGRRRRRRPKTPSGPAAEAFARGAKLFKQLDYKSAIEAFEASYKASAHYLTLCNIARCHERRNDMIKAAEYYERCLDQGGTRSRKARRFEKALSNARALIATVRVTSPGKGGIVHIDGRSRGVAALEVRLNPGSHVIEVRRDGAKPARVTIETRGGTQDLELVPLDLKPQTPPKPAPPAPEPVPPEPPERSGLSSTWFWVSAGVTAGLAAAAAIVGGLTIKANADFDDGPTWDGYDKVIDLRLVTNILWGATAAAAGVTTALFFYTDFGGAEEASEGSDQADAGTFVIGLQGRF
jgi:hypothetical protein